MPVELKDPSVLVNPKSATLWELAQEVDRKLDIKARTIIELIPATSLDLYREIFFGEVLGGYSMATPGDPSSNTIAVAALNNHAADPNGLTDNAEHSLVHELRHAWQYDRLREQGKDVETEIEASNINASSYADNPFELDAMRFEADWFGDDFEKRVALVANMPGPGNERTGNPFVDGLFGHLHITFKEHAIRWLEAYGRAMYPAYFFDEVEPTPHFKVHDHVLIDGHMPASVITVWGDSACVSVVATSAVQVIELSRLTPRTIEHAPAVEQQLPYHYRAHHPQHWHITARADFGQRHYYLDDDILFREPYLDNRPPFRVIVGADAMMFDVFITALDSGSAWNEIAAVDFAITALQIESLPTARC